MNKETRQRKSVSRTDRGWWETAAADYEQIITDRTPACVCDAEPQTCSSVPVSPSGCSCYFTFSFTLECHCRTQMISDVLSWTLALRYYLSMQLCISHREMINNIDLITADRDNQTLTEILQLHPKSHTFWVGTSFKLVITLWMSKSIFYLVWKWLYSGCTTFVVLPLSCDLQCQLRCFTANHKSSPVTSWVIKVSI